METRTLALYLGCDVLIDDETSGKLVGISHTYDVEVYVNGQWLHHRFCKLVLRPLSSISEEEAVYIADLATKYEGRKYVQVQEIVSVKNQSIICVHYKIKGSKGGNDLLCKEQIIIGEDSIYAREHHGGEIYNHTKGFEITRYLLSKGFDLFGLLESGDAIDATKI